MTSLFKFALVCGAVALTGCASTNPVPNSGDTGVINQIYTRYELRYRAPSCLYTLSPAQIASDRFVEVRVQRDGKYKYFSAFAKGQAPLEAGGKVTVSSVECLPEAIPEVTPIVR